MNDAARDRLSIGGNQPPPEEALPPPIDGVTAEMLKAELTRDRIETEMLIQRAKTAKIDTLEDAGDVQLVVVKLMNLGDALEKRRVARKEPYLLAGRLVDDAYKELINPLESYQKGLRDLITIFNREETRKADAARRKAEDEARRRETEAAAARQRIEQAPADQPSMTDRLELLQAEEAAALAREQAATIRPEPIPSVIGGVSSRRQTQFRIDNLADAVGWLLTVAPDALSRTIEPLIAGQLKAIGPDKVATARHPGVTAWVEAVAIVRRSR